MIDNSISSSFQISDGILTEILRDDNAKIIQLEKWFQPFFAKIHCLAVCMETTVDDLLMLSFLIKKKINFYLQPSGAKDDPVPSFCDYVIKGSIYKSRSFELITSPIAVNGTFDDHYLFDPNEGNVVFSSSGSTGAPKYIHHTIENILLNSRNVANTFKIASDTRVLLPVPANHMYGFGVGFVPALISGAKLMLVNKANVIRVVGQLTDFQPHIALLTPTLCKMIVIVLKRPCEYTHFVSAGDRVSNELFSKFRLQVGKLTNLYGSTELGAIAITDHSKDADAFRPMPKVAIRVLNGQLVCRHPAGHSSTLEFEKANRRWKRLEHEAEVSTGDRGLVTGNNQFNVLGRMSHSVNRSGFLVSIQEIENLIENAIPSIEEVIVILGREGLKGKELIAILQSDSTPDRAIEIQNICQQKMPKHLVPDVFHVLPSFPRLPSGKPNRIALKEKYST